MIIIAGLGNIGEEFDRTRHNVGFMAVDKMCKDLKTENFKFNKKFEAEVCETNFKQNKIIFIKPSTYMNRSGESIRKILDFYKEKPENLIVIHDELDIDLGNFKISVNRNSAGHKGAQSIIDNLKTKDFTRIRIGIAGKQGKIPTEKFVLQIFSKEELETIDEIIDTINVKIKEELI